VEPAFLARSSANLKSPQNYSRSAETQSPSLPEDRPGAVSVDHDLNSLCRFVSGWNTTKDPIIPVRLYGRMRVLESSFTSIQGSPFPESSAKVRVLDPFNASQESPINGRIPHKPCGSHAVDLMRAHEPAKHSNDINISSIAISLQKMYD
jgi:hypothetical protein